MIHDLGCCIRSMKCSVETCAQWNSSQGADHCGDLYEGVQYRGVDPTERAETCERDISCTHANCCTTKVALCW